MDKTAYFGSRSEVGKDFAAQLIKLQGQPVAVLALSLGGASVGIEIARSLHGIMGLLLLKHIYLPGERKPLGVVNEQGKLTYGIDISKAFVEEFEMEYRGTIEDDKQQAVSELHALGSEGTLSPHYFSDKNVVIVSDFSKTGTAFKAAVDFLKPVHTRKIILATAIAQLPTIDIMHILGDQILIAHATDKDLPPEHYFARKDNDTKHLVDLLIKQFTLKL